MWQFENLKVISGFQSQFSNFQIFKFSNWVDEQDHKLFQRELQGVGGESDLANLDTVAAEHGDRSGSYRYHNSYGMGDGFFQQPVIKADLFII